MDLSEVKIFLDEKVDQYNTLDFITSDPISIPKRFSRKEDIEIAGFIAATIAWGQRSAIIKSAEKIMNWMDEEPYEYVMEGNFDNIPEGAVYRTFNNVDFRYILHGLRSAYRNHGGLEKMFTDGYQKRNSVFDAISDFRQVFTAFEEPYRTGKHLANVDKGSSAKRINMFLRWMVRKDARKVDFGLWKGIDMKDLMLPLDVHTGNVGRKLGILTRKQSDWKAVEEITKVLRNFDTEDPVKYDFALFGLGVFEKF